MSFKERHNDITKYRTRHENASSLLTDMSHNDITKNCMRHCVTRNAHLDVETNVIERGYIRTHGVVSFWSVFSSQRHEFQMPSMLFALLCTQQHAP